MVASLPPTRVPADAAAAGGDPLTDDHEQVRRDEDGERRREQPDVKGVEALEGKCADDPAHPRFIRTVGGIGYRFEDGPACRYSPLCGVAPRLREEP